MASTLSRAVCAYTAATSRFFSRLDKALSVSGLPCAVGNTSANRVVAARQRCGAARRGGGRLSGRDNMAARLLITDDQPDIFEALRLLLRFPLTMKGVQRGSHARDVGRKTPNCE